MSTCNVSDACGRLAIDGAAHGILPLFPCAKIVGHAATLKLTKAGGSVTQSPVTGTLEAIAMGGAGAVLVIDCRDNPTVNCFGGIAGATSKWTDLVGCVGDGVMRDVDEYKLADDNGVAVVPRARVDEVLQIALVIKATEDRLVAEIRGGGNAVAAHRKINYDDLLKPSPA